MSHNSSIDGSGAEEHECSKEAEQTSVCELKDSSQQRRQNGNLWVCEPEFVEVVDMSDAEIQWCKEDDVLWRGFGQ